MATHVAISPNLSSPEGEGFQPSPTGTLNRFLDTDFFITFICNAHCSKPAKPDFDLFFELFCIMTGQGINDIPCQTSANS
jgi:hypothetical protein